MQRYKKKFELQSPINSFCCRFNNLWDKLGVIGGRGKARKTRNLENLGEQEKLYETLS